MVFVWRCCHFPLFIGYERQISILIYRQHKKRIENLTGENKPSKFFCSFFFVATQKMKNDRSRSHLIHTHIFPNDIIPAFRQCKEKKENGRNDRERESERDRDLASPKDSSNAHLWNSNAAFSNDVPAEIISSFMFFFNTSVLVRFNWVFGRFHFASETKCV